ncbi:MAG TPA: glycosyltransferase family 87 protein [Ktedonobacteraceae bacterium]|nr:glycosyltransferase family 87 protein [Ktedonobacteraceae bacterium]
MIKRATVLWILLDVAVLIIMGVLLFWGAAWRPDAQRANSESWQVFRPYTDVAKYQCYVAAFMHGLPGLKPFSPEQCSFITNPDPSIKYINQTQILTEMQKYHLPGALIQLVQKQNPNEPLHSLPREYPLLTLVPFSLSAIGPGNMYQVRYAFLMELVVAITYILLACFRSRKAAIVAVLYIVAGGWATAAGRFDLVPAFLTLVALIFATRKHWNWAFAFLALATMAKYYPAILLIPFLLAQQFAISERWYAWRRWLPLAVYVVICGVLTCISLLLSVEGTLGTLSYFSNRPVQVESMASSLIWVASHFGFPIQGFEKTYGSLNVFSPLSKDVSLLASVGFAAGILYTYWLQWRRKIDLGLSCVLILLIVLLTGKVFSPQYLLWVAPLVAFVGEADWRWLLSWGLISLLTTWDYPIIYDMVKVLDQVPYLSLFYPVVTIRNLLLLGLVVVLLCIATFRRRIVTHEPVVVEPGPSPVALAQQ